MSDPMSNAEIEDVLRSIRRLVSDDLRPAPHQVEPPAVEASAEPQPGPEPERRLLLTPSLRVVSPVPPPEASPVEAPVEAAVEDTWQEEADWLREPLAPLDWSDPAPAAPPETVAPPETATDVATEAELPPADQAEAVDVWPAEVPPADQFVLNSAQDGVAEVPDDLSQTDTLPAEPVLAEPVLAGATPHRFTLTGVLQDDSAWGHAADALPDDLPETLAQAMAEETVLPAAAPMPWDPSLDEAGPFDPSPVDDAGTGDLAWAEVLVPEDPSTAPASLSPEAEATAGGEAEAETGAEILGDAVTSEAYWDESVAASVIETQAPAEVFFDTPTESEHAITDAIAEQPRAETPEEQAAAAAALDSEAWADRAAAEAIAGLTADAAAQAAPDLEDSDTLTGDIEFADTETGETEAGDAEIGAIGLEPDVSYDEELLRDLVRDILREELAGALGEKITRNVRKLVRAEIAQALAARDLD